MIAIPQNSPTTAHGSPFQWTGVLLLFLQLAGVGCREQQQTPGAPSSTLHDQSQSWLEDATDKFGLSFSHDVGQVGRYFMPESLGSGAAIFDFDNDGRMDLLLLQNGGPESQSKHQLFHQEVEGQFRNVSAGSGLDVAGHGMGVAIGDVDNDGLPDVAITEYEKIRLFHNRGGGRFAEAATQSGLENPHWGMSACFFDYDRDGWLDLAVVNYIDYSPSMKCPEAQGTPGYCGPSGFKGTVPRLFRNLGAEGKGIRFADVTVGAGLANLAGPGLGIVCADFDGDRWPDLLIANDGHVNWLLVNQRDGTFTEQAAARGVAYNRMGSVEANMGVAMGDVDADGLFDILITHLNTETHTLWRQEPRGQFRDRTAQSRIASSNWRGTGFGTVLTDLNNDASPDLVVVNGGIKRLGIEPAPNGKANRDPFWNGFEQRNQVFANNGSGTFEDISARNLSFSGTAAVSRGLAAGDLDNDGATDLVVTRIAASARIYRNVAPRAHWLTLRLVDPALGGRDAYGAEVRIVSGGRRQTAWLNPAYSYLCSNDPRIHFGLGSSSRAESIHIVWPNGSEEQFDGVAAARIITLRKGTGRSLVEPSAQHKSP